MIARVIDRAGVGVEFGGAILVTVVADATEARVEPQVFRDFQQSMRTRNHRLGLGVIDPVELFHAEPDQEAVGSPQRQFLHVSRHLFDRSDLIVVLEVGRKVDSADGHLGHGDSAP